MRDDTGKLVGYDVDVAHGLADALGVPARLTPVTSANRLQKLARGEIDVVVATLGDNLSRRRLVTMIEPQYYGDGANVLLRTDAGISSWEDLRGRTLCSLQGSLWNRLASERLLVKTISLNSTREAALALRNGHCVGWLYDEVNLLSALAGGGWSGFGVSLPTRFVAPWAIAIKKEEAGGRLDRLLGDKLASWHRDGFLQELEKRWKLPPSPYLRRAREVWQRKDEAGNLVCRRDEAGNWPLECRERALVTSQELGGLTAISMAFKESTGLDISPVYDPLDRNVFLHGLFLTVALSIATVVGSVVFGALFGWVMHRRIAIAAPFLHAFCAVLRMTPPLLQLYVVFFGIGGILFALRLHARRVFARGRGAVALCRGQQRGVVLPCGRCSRPQRRQSRILFGRVSPGLRSVPGRDSGQFGQHRQGDRYGEHAGIARAGACQHGDHCGKGQ